METNLVDEQKSLNTMTQLTPEPNQVPNPEPPLPTVEINTDSELEKETNLAKVFARKQSTVRPPRKKRHHRRRRIHPAKTSKELTSQPSISTATNNKFSPITPAETSLEPNKQYPSPLLFLGNYTVPAVETCNYKFPTETKVPQMR